LLLFSFTACTKGDKVNNAIEKTAELSAKDAEVLIAVDGYLGADYFSIDIKDYILINGDSAVVTPVLNDTAGQQIKYEGDFVYVGEEKHNRGDYVQANGSYDDIINAMLIKFSSAALEDVIYESYGNKETAKFFILEGTLADHFPALWENICKGIESYGCSVENLVAGEATVSIYMYEGYATRVEVTFTLNNKEVNLSLHFGVFINNPGEEVTVK
jgi:hypothetical protein